MRRLRGVQLVLTGCMALDSGRGELAPRLAIELGDWPVLMDAEQLRLEGNHISCLQFIEDSSYASSYPLPAVVSVRQTPEHPRYPHGADIINAYRAKNVEVWSSLMLGIDLSTLPAPTTDRRLRVPAEREYGLVLEGSATEAAEALVANLKTRRIL
jgi:electron transfer flavoprotein alpha/beta subunit